MLITYDGLFRRHGWDEEARPALGEDLAELVKVRVPLLFREGAVCVVAAELVHYEVFQFDRLGDSELSEPLVVGQLLEFSAVSVVDVDFRHFCHCVAV